MPKANEKRSNSKKCSLAFRRLWNLITSLCEAGNRNISQNYSPLNIVHSFPVEEVLEELTFSKIRYAKQYFTVLTKIYPSRTEAAPNGLRPLFTVPEELKGFTESLRLHESDSKKGIKDPGLINSDDAARAANG